MIVPKLTRQMIYAAKGRSVEIAWPEDGPEPLKGHTYTVQSSTRRAGEARIMVEQVTELPEGKWRAMVRLAEELRPLRISAKRGIDPEPMGGPQFRSELEPEQVDDRYQRLLREEGRMKSAKLSYEQRMRGKAMRAEQEVADKRKKGKSGPFDNAAAERARRRLEAA